MIKHGQVYSYKREGKARGRSHLEPILDHITKGVADAKENITLDIQACDAKGAKKHDPQQCVIAKALNRTFKPDAVTVGRSLAYVVIRGLAIRFQVPSKSRTVLEEFDTNGRIRKAPVQLNAPCSTWGIGNRHQLLDKRTYDDRKNATKKKQVRVQKVGVRVIGA